MTKSIFHVAFTPSGAENLRYALQAAGRDDRVIAFSDDLRFGPIDCDDPSPRAKWIKDELGLTGWGDVAAESEWFWHQAPFRPTSERSRGCHGDARWNMPAFWNGCGGGAIGRAKSST